MSIATEPKTSGEKHVYLVGHTPFKQYLDFMSKEPVEAQTMDRKRVADEWRAANEHMSELQRLEPSWADNPPVRPVPQAMEPLVVKVFADPIYHKAFSSVPVEIGLVELDRLVVRQKSINLVHVQRLKDRLGSDLSQETVFRLCLPFDHPMVPYRYGYVGENTFVFISESNDIRFLDSVVLRPEQIGSYQTSGPIASVVGLVVGYGSNYLNAISAEGRMVLNNGSHRAYALRDSGVTHVPCVIQKVATRDELGVVAAGALRRDPDLYLKQSRPPVLKDYFNPRLCRIVCLPPTARHVRIRFTTETFDVPGKS